MTSLSRHRFIGGSSSATFDTYGEAQRFAGDFRAAGYRDPPELGAAKPAKGWAFAELAEAYLASRACERGKSSTIGDYWGRVANRVLP